LGYLDTDDRGTRTTGTLIENTSTIVAPDMFGRGTTVLDTHSANYSLSYYAISATSAVVIENDGSRIATGTIARQY
jgi:hypothetical protein